MKQGEILQKVAAGEITAAEATELLAANETKQSSLYCKVSEKGCVSVYGLRRFPVSLYPKEWEQLLDFGDDIIEFIKEHKSELKPKPK